MRFEEKDTPCSRGPPGSTRLYPRSDSNIRELSPAENVGQAS